MIWNRPLALIGLIAIPIVFFFISKYAHKQYNTVMNIFSKEMQDRLIVPRSKFLSTTKTLFLLAATIAFVFFLAGPKSTELDEKTNKSLGRDIFILFDVSESMLAEDMKPNRLTIAKLDVEEILDAAIGDRIGLIAFSGSAQVETPLTSDYEFFRNILRKIDTTTLQTSGTVIGDAIRLALERFGSGNNRSQAIILITDGEDHDSLPLEAARNAFEAKVPIFVIAIGDLRGSKIPVMDASGRRSYKMYDGETVISKPDVDVLKDIARISGGQFYYAGNQLNLAKVYEETVDTLERSEISENNHAQLKDLYQPFLAIGLFAFVLYYLTPTHLSNRSKRRNAFFLSSLFLIASCFITNDCFGNNDEVLSYASEQIAQNRTSDRSSARKDIRDYNDAMILFEQGETDKALASLLQLSDSKSNEVASRSNYNLGVYAFKKAQSLSAELLALSENESTKEEEGETKQKHNDVQGKASEIVAKYNEERANRNVLRQEISEAAQESSRYFNRTPNNNKRNIASRNNAEIVTNWLQEHKKNEQIRELELRSNELVSPYDRLDWLQNEIGEYIERLEDISDKTQNVISFQTMFDDSKSLPMLEQDVNAVAENIVSDNQETTQQTDKLQPYETLDSIGIGKIESAKSQFVKLIQEAANSSAQYESDKSRRILRNAQNQLQIIANVPKTYVELVIQTAKDEESVLQTQTVENLLHQNRQQIESYYWNRKALLDSVNEFTRKAQSIVEVADTSVDLDDVFENQSKEPEYLEKESQLHQPISGSSDSSEESEPAETAKSQEEKILESAKIALLRQSELSSLITQSHELLGNDVEQITKIDSQKAQSLASAQKRISEIMQEIVRPLQDEQQDSPNQQNQDNNDNSQNENQQDQNDQQDSQKQDKSNQSQNNSQSPEESPTPQGSQEEDKQFPNSQPQLEEETSQKTETETNNKEQEQLTPEEKEAESLMRQVERRQKDAEEQRRLIQQALRKREKTGKDW